MRKTIFAAVAVAAASLVPVRGLLGEDFEPVRSTGVLP